MSLRVPYDIDFARDQRWQVRPLQVVACRTATGLVAELLVLYATANGRHVALRLDPALGNPKVRSTRTGLSDSRAREYFTRIAVSHCKRNALHYAEVDVLEEALAARCEPWLWREASRTRAQATSAQLRSLTRQLSESVFRACAVLPDLGPRLHEYQAVLARGQAVPTPGAAPYIPGEADPGALAALLVLAGQGFQDGEREAAGALVRPRGVERLLAAAERGHLEQVQVELTCRLSQIRKATPPHARELLAVLPIRMSLFSWAQIEIAPYRTAVADWLTSPGAQFALTGRVPTHL